MSPIAYMPNDRVLYYALFGPQVSVGTIVRVDRDEEDNCIYTVHLDGPNTLHWGIEEQFTRLEDAGEMPCISCGKDIDIGAPYGMCGHCRREQAREEARP